MKIINAILHEVVKKFDSKGATLSPRDECYRQDDKILNEFTNAVLTVYSESINSYGNIKKNDGPYFNDLLKSFTKKENKIKAEDKFLSLTVSASELIRLHIQDVYKATGGFVLFVNYSDRGSLWLLIVMLKLDTGYSIDKKSKSLQQIDIFNMKHFHEAARINLDAWQEQQKEASLNQEEELADDYAGNRCVSFIKQKGNDDDITRYFREALDCTDFAASHKNTSLTLSALDDFYKHKAYAPNKVTLLTNKVSDYYFQKIEEDEPASLKFISAIVSDEDDANEFLDFTKQNGFDISYNYKPSKSLAKKMVRISGKIGSTTLNFDSEQINKTVFLNEANRSITFTTVSDEIIQQIKRAQGNVD